jgi:integrase
MANRDFSTLGDQEIADLIQRHLERLLEEEEDRRAEGWVVGDDRLEEARSDLARLRAMIRRDLRNGRLDIGEAHSRRILASGEAERPAEGLENPRFARFLRTIMQGLDRYIGVESARDEGRYNVKLEPVAFGSATAAPPAPVEHMRPAVTPRPQASEGHRPLSFAVAQYRAEQMTSGVTVKTTHQITQTLRMFQELHGDLPMGRLGREHVVAFKAALLKLPRSYGQSPLYAGKPLPQILRMAAEAGEQEPPITGKTVNRHLSMVSSFYRWAGTHGFGVPEDGASKLMVKKRRKHTARQERDPFSPSELAILFGSPLWTGCRSEGRRLEQGSLIIKDARYWVPLISVYAGLRLEEVCQLRLTDLTQWDGAWFFRLRDTPETPLKTLAAARDVPVHPTLISLGLIEYRQQLLAMPVRPAQLFPDLLKRDKFGDCSPPVSKWFTRYRRDLGLVRPKIAFHSLRHTFKDALERARVRAIVMDSLMGHGEDRDDMSKRYGGSADRAELIDAIQAVRYGLWFEEPSAARSENNSVQSIAIA